MVRDLISHIAAEFQLPISANYTPLWNLGM